VIETLSENLDHLFIQFCPTVCVKIFQSRLKMEYCVSILLQNMVKSKENLSRLRIGEFTVFCYKLLLGLQGKKEVLLLNL
jgi:hypothetical protein